MRKPKQYDEEILSFLKDNPSTYEEIGRLGLPPYSSGTVLNYTRELLMTDKVRKVTVRLQGTLAHPRAHRRTIFYLPGEEKLLGEKVTRFLPNEVESEKIRRRINKALESSLPKEAFQVAEYYVRLK